MYISILANDSVQFMYLVCNLITKIFLLQRKRNGPVAKRRKRGGLCIVYVYLVVLYVFHVLLQWNLIVSKLRLVSTTLYLSVCCFQICILFPMILTWVLRYPNITVPISCSLSVPSTEAVFHCFWWTQQQHMKIPLRFYTRSSLCNIGLAEIFQFKLWYSSFKQFFISNSYLIEYVVVFLFLPLFGFLEAWIRTYLWMYMF